MTEGSELAIASGARGSRSRAARRGGRRRAPGSRGLGPPPPRRQGSAQLRPGSLGAIGSRGASTGSRPGPCGRGFECRRGVEATQRRGGRPGPAGLDRPRDGRARRGTSQLRAASASASTPLTLNAHALGRTRPRRCPRSPLPTIATTERQRGAQVLRREGALRRHGAHAAHHRRICLRSSRHRRGARSDASSSTPASRAATCMCELHLARPPQDLRLRGRRRRDGPRRIARERRRSSASGRRAITATTEPVTVFVSCPCRETRSGASGRAFRGGRAEHVGVRAKHSPGRRVRGHRQRGDRSHRRGADGSHAPAPDRGQRRGRLRQHRRRRAARRAASS